MVGPIIGNTTAPTSKIIFRIWHMRPQLQWLGIGTLTEALAVAQRLRLDQVTIPRGSCSRLLPITVEPRCNDRMTFQMENLFTGRD
jgi:hypothetical protein